MQAPPFARPILQWVPSSIKTTMDRYVHVTDASLTNAVKQFEQSTTMAS